MRYPATLLAALAGSVGLVVAAPTPAFAAAKPASCSTIFDVRGASCATFTVPLDRSGAVAGRTKLFTELVRARGGARNSTIVVFPGGPGSATTIEGKELIRDLGKARAGHDLLLFDERGTGRSDYLDCDLALTPNYPAPPGEDAHQRGKGVERCAKKLGARRGLYTTRETVADLEDVRQALGIDKFIVYGVSYGTRDAMAYATAHPDHVERMVLDSPVTAAGLDPFGFSSLHALPRVFSQLCRGGGCNGIASDPAADLSRVVKRLEQGPMRAKQPVTLMGCRLRPAIMRSGIYGLLQQVDEDPTLLSQLPVALAEAAKGRPYQLSVLEASQSRYLMVCGLIRSIKRLISPGKGVKEDIDVLRTSFSSGDQIARLCEESALPWPRDALVSQRQRYAEAALASLGDESFAPLDRATILAGGLVPVCKFWVAANAQQPVAPTSSAPVPTLVVSGLDDLRTPTEDAAALAAASPSAQLLRVPDIGHSVIQSSRCARGALLHFMHDEPFPQCHEDAHHKPKPMRHVLSLRDALESFLEQLPTLPGYN